MLVVRNYLGRSAYRPLQERLYVSFPQFLLETTGMQVWQQTSASRKEKAAELDKPLVYKPKVESYKGRNSTLNLTQMAQSDWRNVCFTASIFVPQGRNEILQDPETNEFYISPEDHVYYVEVSMDNAMPTCIWPAFAEAYAKVAKNLFTGKHIDVRRGSMDPSEELIWLDPANWLDGIAEYVPVGSTTGKSQWSQNTFKKAVFQAFKQCDIHITCTCSWYDKQLKDSGLDWTVRNAKTDRYVQSVIDTRAGQKLASHKGSVISQALANGDSLWRDERDRVVKTNRVTKRSHPIGSQGRGGFQLPNGEYVVNTSMIRNSRGEIIAYPNGDPYEGEQPSTANIKRYDSEASHRDPCAHITRVLQSFLETNQYNISQLVAQGFGSTLWVNGDPNPLSDMVQAWSAWANGTGKGICNKVIEQVKSDIWKM